jgi:PilZ domain
MVEAPTERRGEQRFPLRLPVVVKSFHDGVQEEPSVTRDVSARGVFFYFDRDLAEGTPLELVLTLPAEITLSESIRVRCRGKVVRVIDSINGGKKGVAALIEQYDFVAGNDPSF